MLAEIRFSVVRSSRGRYWNGFDAAIYEATPGYDETLCANHSISMHLGPPVAVTSRCDGSALRRLTTRGDIKIIPAGFSRVWEIEQPARKLTINISRGLMEAAADALGIDPARVSITPHLHVRDPRIEHIGWALAYELESDEPVGRLYAESLGTALATHLARRYARAELRAVQGCLPKQRLRRVTEYIAEHLSAELSLVRLAQLVNVSPSHFNVLFKQTMGISVHQYVIRARVEHAVRLIAGTSLPLSDVALQAGFANQSHMASCMQRIAGATPGSLRRGIV